MRTYTTQELGAKRKKDPFFSPCIPAITRIHFPDLEVLIQKGLGFIENKGAGRPIRWLWREDDSGNFWRVNPVNSPEDQWSSRGLDGCGLCGRNDVEHYYSGLCRHCICALRNLRTDKARLAQQDQGFRRRRKSLEKKLDKFLENT